MMEAELCSAFSDPTRILILYELDEHPRTVRIPRWLPDRIARL